MNVVRTYRIDFKRDAAFKFIHSKILEEMGVRKHFEQQGVIVKLYVDVRNIDDVIERFSKVKLDFRRWPILEEN